MADQWRETAEEEVLLSKMKGGNSWRSWENILGAKTDVMGNYFIDGKSLRDKGRKTWNPEGEKTGKGLLFRRGKGKKVKTSQS